MKIIALLILSLTCSATTLNDVVYYSLKNAPQFQEEQLSTQAGLESLKKVFAIYDTQLALAHSYNQGINPLSLQNETTNTTSLGLSKNLGAGVTLGVSSQLYNKKGSSSINYQTSVKVTADIDLLQNLLGKIDRSSVLIQEQDKRIIKNALQQTKQTLIFGIVESYLNLVRLEKLLQENEKLNKNIRTLEQATKRKKKIGAVDSRSVLQMEAKLISSKINILELERLVDDNYQQLKVITGGGEFKNLSWPKVESINKNKVSNLKLEALAIEKEKLGLQRSSSNWQRLPQLKLSISYQYGDMDTSSYSYQMEENGKGVGLYLNFPLGNTIDLANYNMYQNRLLSQKLTIRREQDEFNKDFLKYERAIHNYKKQIALSTNVVTLQKIRYTQELTAYKQGRTGINDINTAQNDYINAEITHIERESSLHKFIFGKSYLLSSLSSLFNR